MNDEQDRIQSLLLTVMYEATTGNYYSSKALRLLDLRSELQKKRKQLEDYNPQNAQRLNKISEKLLDAERELGVLIQENDENKKDNTYVPLYNEQPSSKKNNL